MLFIIFLVLGLLFVLIGGLMLEFVGLSKDHRKRSILILVLFITGIVFLIIIFGALI